MMPRAGCIISQIVFIPIFFVASIYAQVALGDGTRPARSSTPRS